MVGNLGDGGSAGAGLGLALDGRSDYDRVLASDPLFGADLDPDLFLGVGCDGQDQRADCFFHLCLFPPVEAKTSTIYLS